MIKRDEVLVYFNYRGDTANYFKSLGVTVQYLNKKLGYAVLYVDDVSLDKTINALRKMRGFKKYEVSNTDLVELDV